MKIGSLDIINIILIIISSSTHSSMSIITLPMFFSSVEFVACIINIDSFFVILKIAINLSQKIN